MAAKTFYFKDAVPSGATAHRSLQDGGTAPTAATTGTGWIAGTNAAGQSCLQNGGSKVARLDGQWGTTLQPSVVPSLSLGDCWRSEGVINGVFANTDWTLNFRIISGVSAYTGRFKLGVRLWRSSDPTGASATEITSARLASAATAADLSTSTVTAIPITFTPGGTITLANEYLFISVGIEVTLAGSGNSQDMQFRVSSGGTVVSPEFTDNFILSCASGSYTYTGITSTLSLNRCLSCDVGSYTYTGLDSVLTYGYYLMCNVGSYTYNGIDSILVYGKSLVCSTGSYTYSPGDISFNSTHTLLCDPGIYTYVGIDATLRYTINNSLICAAGGYSYVGNSATLTVRHNLVCTVGNYTYTAGNLMPTFGYKLLCNSGSYIYTGNILLPIFGYYLPCDTGAYTYESGIAYLQVISSTAFPPILYSSIPTVPKTESIVYTPITTTSEDDLTSKLTTATTTPILEVAMGGAGGTSTLISAGTKFKRANDILHPSDSTSILVNKTFTDAVTTSDSVVVTSTLGKPLIEATTTSESRSITVGKNLTNTINSSEVIAKVLERIISESITPIENVSKLLSKPISDNVLYSENLSTAISAQDFVLKEDGSFVLREDTYFIIRETFTLPDTSESIGYTELISLGIQPLITSTVTNTEVVLANVTKSNTEIATAIETISLALGKLISDSSTAVESKIMSIESNPTSDSCYADEIVSRTIGKVISDSISTTDSISNKSISKLLADSYSASDLITSFDIHAQDFRLAEDGTFILREDSFYLVNEVFSPTPSSDSISYAEALSYNLSKAYTDSALTVSDTITKLISLFPIETYSANDSNITFSLSKAISNTATANESISISSSITIVSPVSILENITLDLTNFLLQEDDTYYILREDDTNFLREI